MGRCQAKLAEEVPDESICSIHVILCLPESWCSPRRNGHNHSIYWTFPAYRCALPSVQVGLLKGVHFHIHHSHLRWSKNGLSGLRGCSKSGHRWKNWLSVWGKKIHYCSAAEVEEGRGHDLGDLCMVRCVPSDDFVALAF